MLREGTGCAATLFQSAETTKTARRMLCASGAAQRQRCVSCCLCWSMCEFSVCCMLGVLKRVLKIHCFDRASGLVSTI